MRALRSCSINDRGHGTREVAVDHLEVGESDIADLDIVLRQAVRAHHGILNNFDNGPAILGRHDHERHRSKVHQL